MNDLVFLTDGEILVSSKDIADRFGKTHRNTQEAIERIISSIDSDFGCAIFRTSTYTSEQNKILPCYMMTRDGFALLAMGFTGKKALAWKVKYIQAFNAMEQALLERSSLMQQFNDAINDMEKDKELASKFGRGLSLWREIKTQHNSKITSIESKLQLILPFSEAD